MHRAYFSATIIDFLNASSNEILLLPYDSSGFSVKRGRMLAEHLGIRYELFDIAPTLEAIGCYKWRDEAIRGVFPEYGEGWKNKIVIAGGLEGRVNHFQLVVQTPSGETRQARLGLKEYLQIVAATNIKQRTRKMLECYYADRLHFAVAATPNRLEYDQGFFVKNGDGASDFKPIAHLYKSQVYMMAAEIGVPRVVIFSAGTGNPYFSTDTAAALRATEIGADVVIKATKVGGVYDSDPKKNSSAVKFDRMIHLDFMRRRLGVMDSTAVTLCMENNLPILVLNFWDINALIGALRGEPVGTLVTG